MRRRSKLKLDWVNPKKAQTKGIMVRVDADLHARAEAVRKVNGHKWTEIIEAALEGYLRAYTPTDSHPGDK